MLCVLLIICPTLAFAASPQAIYKKLLKATGVRALPFYVISKATPLCSLACTDGRAIYVSTKLLATVRNEDELAGVIGHEMAHAVYSNESRADVLGLKYAARAGYRYCVAAQFLKQLSGDDRHPDGYTRYKNTGCS